MSPKTASHLPVSSRDLHSTGAAGTNRTTQLTTGADQTQHLVDRASSDNLLSISSLNHSATHPSASLGEMHQDFFHLHPLGTPSPPASVASDPTTFHVDNDLFGISSEVEDYFTHNFKCCGMHLKDMHESLLHYEMYHVRDERHTTGAPRPLPSASTATGTVDYRQRQIEMTSRMEQHRFQPYLTTRSLSRSPAPVVEHDQRRRNRLVLEIEPNDNPRADPHKIAAFDDTVIRNSYFARPTPVTGNKSLPLASYNNLRIPSDNGALASVPNEPTVERRGLDSAAIKSASTAKTMELEFFPDDDDDDDEVEFEAEHDSLPGQPFGGTVGYRSSNPTSGTFNSYRKPTDSTEEAGHKPYACLFPGCTKTYKNPNGLKYHTLHGHKSTTNDLEKPYECTFATCTKRFKNPNGLKYHLEHAHKPPFQHPHLINPRF